VSNVIRAGAWLLLVLDSQRIGCVQFRYAARQLGNEEEQNSSHSLGYAYISPRIKHRSRDPEHTLARVQEEERNTFLAAAKKKLRGCCRSRTGGGGDGGRQRGARSWTGRWRTGSWGRQTTWRQDGRRDLDGEGGAALQLGREAAGRSDDGVFDSGTRWEGGGARKPHDGAAPGPQGVERLPGSACPAAWASK